MQTIAVFSTSVVGFEALICLDSDFDKAGKNKFNCEQQLQTNVGLACFSTVLRKPRIYRQTAWRFHATSPFLSAVVTCHV